MNLETSKYLGGIGALFLVIGPLATFAYAWSGLLSLVGFIMVLVALKGLGDHYNEGGIFNNALYGFITTIVGGVAFVGVMVATLLSVLADLGIDNWADPEAFASALTANLTDFSFIFDLLSGLIVAIVVLFIFAIISAIFYRKSLGLLSSKSGVGMFGTAGLLILVGAVLTIVLFGAIIIWIAFILLTVAFFSLKTTAETPPT